MREATRWKKTWLALSAIGVRLFRNQVGAAYMGRGIDLKPGQVYRATGGERLIFEPRHVNFGLVKGSADGIGWHSVEVTEQMVGRKLAVFVSVEQKTPTGRATPEQKNWMEQVRKAGGIAIITKDPERVVEEFENGR